MMTDNVQDTHRAPTTTRERVNTQGCSYQLSGQGVHVFTFTQGTRDAVDQYAAYWAQVIPAYWRDHPLFDGTNRTLIDFTHVERLPVAYLHKSMQGLLDKYAGMPPIREGFLLTLNPALIAYLKTIARSLLGHPLSKRALFVQSERCKAMEWLVSGQ